MAGVFCFVCLFIAAMLHLHYSTQEFHLSGKISNSAFGLGMVAGLLTLGFGTLLKRPLWGLSLGLVICYFLTVGYIVVGHGIPAKWIY